MAGFSVFGDDTRMMTVSEIIQSILSRFSFSNLPVALLSLIAGMWIQKRLDGKRRVKAFFAEYYQDMWRVVQNVDGVIQRRRRVDHDAVMEQIKQKYSCGDINAFLRDCAKTDDARLRKLLNQFSENLIAYSSEMGRLQFPSMGDGQTDYAGISNDLTEKIRKRLNKYLKS